MQTLNAEFLNSSWLIKMLEKSSNKPRVRLLNLFDILDDWLELPYIAPNSALTITPSVILNTGLQTQAPDKCLQDYLALEAAKAGAAMPEMLASQLYFIALAAAQEKLQSNNPKSLQHAKNAAKALIDAQIKKELSFKKFGLPKNIAYAVAASSLAVCVVAIGLFVLNFNGQANYNVAGKQIPIQAAIPQLVIAEAIADPQQTAALIAQINQMRSGNCQLIEAIQLPDSQKGIYINMVVNGQVSTNPAEQAIALDLLRKTRCNYTPMLMANSR